MSRRKTWREVARPIIAEVIKENQGKTPKELRKAIADAYPFGERMYHPYKIWCDEVRVQTGKKKKKPRGKKVDDPKQTDLFK